MKGLGAILFSAIILISTSMSSSAQTPTTPQQIKTDIVARKAIRLLGEHQPDSVYALTGDAFKQQVTLAKWQTVCETQLYGLLPFKSMVFKGSDALVNKYKLEGKINLTMLVSLDDKGLIVDFLFLPYKEDLQPLAMTEDDKKTDMVAMKVYDYLNAKKADSAYVFAGDAFKKYMDASAWRDAMEKQIYPMLPFAKPVFMGSKQGISKYKMNQLQLIIGLDATGRFNGFAIQPYTEDAQKIEKAATDNPMHSTLDSVINRWLSHYIQTKGNVGISAAVHYKGKDHFYNYGETALGNHKLPDAHTLYELGSITKTFTATILAKAVTDGLTTLNTPIIKYLPDSVASNPNLKPITLKELANHTSGLPRMPNNIDATVTNLAQPYENYDEAHMFAYLKSFKAPRGAGVSYEYSNLGAGLLGVILEKIYHKPYAELVKLYVTQPLLMTDTKITLTPLEAKRLATGYDASGNVALVWKQNSTKAAGALISSAFDLLQYGKKQLPAFVSPLSKPLALAHLSTFDDGVNRVALGWHYLYSDKDPVIQHTGGTGGCRTAICVNLKTNLVLVILTNNASTGDALGIQLMSALEEALPK